VIGPGVAKRAPVSTTSILPDINSTIAALPRSGIRELMEAVWETPGALVLTAGEPSFPTPPHVVAAANAAALAGKTTYVGETGIPELREALAAKVRAINGYDAQPENIVVSAGGGEGIYASLAALLAPGDGILLPDPGWPNFAMAATMLRAEKHFYSLDAANDWMPDVAELERLCDARTRVLLLNAPSNPLGATITRERLAELVAFAERRGLWILSDECYDEVVFEGGVLSTAAVAGGLDRVISVYTFSKTYAMTGWRIGYVVAPQRAVKQIGKLQEPLISCVNVPTQYGALAALIGPHAIVDEMVATYRERRDTVCALLAQAGIPALRPAGAFYVWADIGASGMNSRDFAFAFLREMQVGVAPGTAFGAHGDRFIRISLATQTDVLLEAMRRLVAFMDRR
jgi:aspartate/methionine/tyrosine aminotransferase